MSKLLLIEDDKDISEMILSFLANEHTIDTAFDGEAGLNMLKESTYDLVILDLMLPKLSGIELLREFRTNDHTPVLILSAKDTDMDKALGLGFGADDYLNKPFSMLELQARIKAIIRRNTVYIPQPVEETITTYYIGDLVLDLDMFTVKKHDQLLKLTSKEFELLKIFITHPNRVFTKAQLYEMIWEECYISGDNIINVHISRLREKIEDDPSNPNYIVTLWGIGYKLGEIK